MRFQEVSAHSKNWQRFRCFRYQLYGPQLVLWRDWDLGARSEMTMNATRRSVEGPEPDLDLSKRIEVWQCVYHAVNGQYENRHVRKIPVPVGLTHAASPVFKFNLKRADGRLHKRQKFLTGLRRFTFTRLVPRNSQQVGNSKSIDCNLTSARHAKLVRPPVNNRFPLHIGFRELNRKPGFSGNCSCFATRQIHLGFPELNLGNSSCISNPHAFECNCLIDKLLPQIGETR